VTSPVSKQNNYFGTPGLTRYTVIVLQVSSSFIDRPVLSLRSGAQVATTVAPVINPTSLKIEGLYCQVRGEKQTLILLSQDIRDTISQGFVINDQDNLIAADDLVRLRDIINMHFEILGKQVVTLNGDKLGKVADYAADSQSMFIHKLYASQSLLKHFTGGMLSIDRTQINEITDKSVIVNDLQQKVPAQAKAVA
jgi:uncharacterized protein YrrD